MKIRRHRYGPLIVLAATAFSLAETALLLSSLQERMYERTVAEPRLCGSFVEGDATLNDQKNLGNLRS
jgi:hypothetical protein